MKVFVTGVNGYIGAVLAPYLLQRGLTVLGLDTGYYRDGWLYSDNRHLAHTPETLHKDLRDITERDLAGCDAVATQPMIMAPCRLQGSSPSPSAPTCR